MNVRRLPRLRLVAALLSAQLCAGGAAWAEAAPGPWSEKDFLALVLNRSSAEARTALGEPAARSAAGNGLEMWLYHGLVLKPGRDVTFPVTQLVVTQGRVVQIGHSEREPPPR